jgi:NAD(P)H-hydrate repair Nnr-like enzyme with NAD(P)H-hydrate epimerase domain
MDEADRLAVATGTPATELVVDAIFGAGLAWTLVLSTVAHALRMCSRRRRGVLPNSAI